MHEPAQIAVVFAWGMVKMLVAAGFGVGFGFSFLETFVWTAAGGCAGVLLFYRLSERLSERWRLRWLRRRTLALRRGVAARRIFTRRNRWIIRVKRASGYLGVAALTPLVLTIPVGSILAARFFHHDRRALPALLVSVLAQALGVSAALTGVVGGILRAVP